MNKCIWDHCENTAMSGDLFCLACGVESALISIDKQDACGEHPDHMEGEPLSRYNHDPVRRAAEAVCGMIFFCFLAWLCCGCGHVRPVISTDARKVIRAGDIINVRQMPEDEALRIYEKTGVYRGLNDDEWIFLINEIDALENLKELEGWR